MCTCELVQYSMVAMSMDISAADLLLVVVGVHVVGSSDGFTIA